MCFHGTTVIFPVRHVNDILILLKKPCNVLPRTIFVRKQVVIGKERQIMFEGIRKDLDG